MRGTLVPLPLPGASAPRQPGSSRARRRRVSGEPSSTPGGSPMPRQKLTPEQRTELARVANAERWARLTRAERRLQTQAARDAKMLKYLEQCPADPEIIDPAEQAQDRMRRALMLRDADLRKARVQ